MSTSVFSLQALQKQGLDMAWGPVCRPLGWNVASSSRNEGHAGKRTQSPWVAWQTSTGFPYTMEGQQWGPLASMLATSPASALLISRLFQNPAPCFYTAASWETRTKVSSFFFLTTDWLLCCSFKIFCYYCKRKAINRAWFPEPRKTLNRNVISF